MEPPVKRRRLEEELEERHGAGVDDGWEEYDGDDDTEAAAIEQQLFVEQSHGHQLAAENSYVDSRFQTTVARIYERNGPDVKRFGNNTDFMRGNIVLSDSRRIASEIAGEEIDHEEQDSDEGDGGQDGDSGDDDQEEGFPINYSSTQHRQEGSQNFSHSHDRSTTATANQPWATDTDEVDVMLDYMQMQGPYPDPDFVDSIPGYSNELAAEDGPSLISGLYDGGSLRYAASVGPYGASPFALGPWEMLPQVQEGHELTNPSALTPARTADFRYREQPHILASPRSSENRPKAIRYTETYHSKDVEREGTGQSANLFEQHPEEASAFFSRDNQAAPSQKARHGVRAKASTRQTKTWHATVAEDSDTVEDPVFSAEEMEASSQTGDDALPSNQAHKSKRSTKIIADTQDALPQEDGAITSIAATARASYNKPSHKDFDLACMLSDDETPLFTMPPGGTTSSNSKKVARSLTKASRVGAPGISSDDTAAKRRRGQSSKHPLSNGRGQKQGSSHPKRHKSRLVGSTSNVPGGQVNTVHGSIPAPAAHFGPYYPTYMPTAVAENESDPESGNKSKQGGPRKPETTQQQEHEGRQPQQAQQPFMQYPPPMFGQPYYFPPFQVGFQPHAFQYPFQPMMPQPFQAYAPPMAYQPLQSPFFQQPILPQLLQRPMHPLLQQLPTQRPPGQAGQDAEQQPVKRKRGRPRKYPVGYKRCRRKGPLAALQNRMAALMGTQSSRLPATEDAWYGVARRLALDLSSLQGGFLFSNGFQMQPQAYEASRSGPCPQPENQYQDGSSDSSSEGESEPDDSGRITEVLDTANDEPSPKGPPGDTCGADEGEGSEGSKYSDSGSSEGPESPGLAANDDDDDDDGFMILESPKSNTKSVGPAPLPPSPPSPPMTARSSSLSSMKEGHSTPTPTRKRITGSGKPTPLQVSKRRTPTPHKSDAFDLTSSPMPAKTRTDTSLIASLEQVVASQQPPEAFDDEPELNGEKHEIEIADSDASDFAEEKFLPFEDDVSTAAQEDEYPEVEPAKLSCPAPNNATTRSPTAPAVGAKSSPVRTPKTPKSKTTPSSKSTARKLSKPASSNRWANPDEILDLCQPEADENSLSGGRNGTSSPPLFISSAPQNPPQTPDKSSLNSAKAVTPQKSPASRSPVVPRSAERCTPIFLDLEFAPEPEKSPSAPAERRAMREVKQAITRPQAKTRDSKSQEAQQLSLKSMFSKHTTDNAPARKEHSSRPPSLPAAEEARRSSWRHVQETRPPAASRHAKPYAHEFDTVKDKKRRKARRSLLSLVPRNIRGQDVEDDEDELGSMVRPKSSASKQRQAPGGSRSGADSAHDKRRFASRTREDGGRPEIASSKDRKREEEKRRKKRRHTEGSVSRGPGSAVSASDGGAVQECGVDGHRCTRDFCFTCL